MSTASSVVVGGRVSLSLVLGCVASVASAQSPSATQATIAAWQALESPTGHEQRAADAIRAAVPGWQQDAAGNLIRRLGGGRPRRVIACALDRPSFAVTQITERGLLRVHRVGGGGHPLFDQFHEGQQVHVYTAGGNVPGVFAIANGHFAAQHRGDTAVVGADDLWLDVGVESAAEARALGIGLLDPVERRVPAWTYAGGVAGNAVGLRAGCAAVAAAGAGRVTAGETVLLMTTQGVFGWPGLGAALATLGPVDELTVLVGGGAGRREQWLRGGGRSVGGVNAAVLRVARLDSLRVVAPAVRFGGSLVETLADADAEWLRETVARVARLEDVSAARWVAPRADADAAPASAGTDAHSRTAERLKRLADLPGVPGDEWQVRDAVRTMLPPWARDASAVDAAGNLIVAAGPERDTTVIIAHLDEVAWDVTAIAADGVVSLRARGGVIPSAWEGQPALLHLPMPRDGSAARTLAGVFVPRSTAAVRAPAQLTAWFGMDSVALVSRGVRVGAGVTAHKDAVRLAATRFTARGLDDRTGSLAIIEALHAIDPSRLRRRVLFVWSSGEEIGLVGAAALAARLGGSVRRVHSIDTFVSSDTPLESPHFAFAPLGDGPVFRAIENSSMAPVPLREEMLRIAREAGIPLQVGLTQGGTDGTAFTYWGAPNIAFSWPGRYSHSPAELLDLRDVNRLAVLIAALALQ